jgi:hypothetical protein
MDVGCQILADNVSAPAAIPFVHEVARLYHRNARLFLKILLPAACFGYVILFLLFQKADDILRTLPRGPAILQYKGELLKQAALRICGLSLEWLLYCFAFAAMSVAVARLVSGDPVFAEDCFAPVRERMAVFLRVTAVLGALVAISFLCTLAVLVWAAIAWSAKHKSLSRQGWSTFSLCVWALLLWGIARFGLAMPIIVLGRGTARGAFKKSYRLTASCSSILALLLLESIGGSYIAYLIPLWIWRAAYLRGFASLWTLWVATILGLLAGLLLQPHALVGFALLYLRRGNREGVALYQGTTSVGPIARDKRSGLQPLQARTSGLKPESSGHG